METQEQIREFIIDNFMMGREAADLTDAGSLLEMGIIDSTGVLELVGFIEQQYGISVEDDELVPENLDSVENLTRFIADKSA